MEFHNILMVASEQQGHSAAPKRYSLAVGPPKKDPKVKGVHSAAVQAFLKRQEEERRKKVLEEKRRKEDLLAKRVELKHDRKARAMASRTKDNFRGYNGIPIEEKPKKRRGRASSSDRITEGEKCTSGDESEQFEYSQTESEHESEEYEERPSKTSVKPKATPKGAPPPLNFTDLLKLAEKKQYEPVEIKVVKKTEERPLTAEELKEREYLERKNRKGIILKEKKVEKEMKPVTASNSSKKHSQKEFINTKLSKHSTDKHSISKGNLSLQSGIEKKHKGPALSEKPPRLLSSSKPNHSEKAKPVHKGPLKSTSSSNHIKHPVNGGGKSGSSSHTPILKTASNGIQKQAPTKELNLKKATSHSKPTAQHESVKNSSRQASSSSSTGGPLPRAKNSLSIGPGRPGSSSHTGHGLQVTTGKGPGRSGSSLGSGQRSSSLSVGPGRPGSSSGPMRNSSQSVGPGRPNSSLNTGLGRGSSSGSGPGRPSSTSVGTLKPKCTVVSETISSKNLVPRQASGQMNGMRPFPPQRSGFPSQGFPRPNLPPITYKRQYEDDEYDSEMDDFIDDEGEPQEEISKHIKEIFGYDRNRYKDESDYALRYMESSWKEQQKEEAKSLRLGMQEDLEELRREEEELKRKRQAKKLRTR
ncbi:protein SPT2 homolog isoform X2 [Hemicordylus capensis]|uniref:protein SPT2 homolog isoform X2 n=1 Tax=Hemicordylus capensis TaxID=884348 RepID=UPI0023034F72|nr:protein SPT2 homolog isoform X2 [Hemicordylus capensis]